MENEGKMDQSKQSVPELLEVPNFDLDLYTLELEPQGQGNIILDPVKNTCFSNPLFLHIVSWGGSRHPAFFYYCHSSISFSFLIGYFNKN